ncbi:MAG: hypothetical protein AB7O45_12380 [Alphaproteobacteria bacterium]
MAPDPRNPGPGTARRWLVFDPGLREVASHHPPAALAIRREATRRGLDLHIFGHRDLDAAMAAEIGAVPHFRFHSYAVPYGDPVAGSLSAFVRGLVRIERDLLALPVGRMGPDDVVLWPTVHAWELMATARVIARMPRDRQPRLAATFHVANELFRSNPDPQEVSRASNRLAGVELARKTDAGRVALLALAPGLAEALSRLYDRQVDVAPSPSAIDLLAGTEPPAAARRSDGQPRIAFPGIPRREKRADLMPAFVAAIAERLPRSPIFVQTDEIGSDRRPVPPMPPREGLSVHLGPLRHDEMMDVYRRSAIVVLPHHPVAYRNRTSGIFIEAVAAGCVLVVARGSSMADQIEGGLAVGMVAASPEPAAFAAAAARAAADLDRLSAAAAIAAARWQRHHGVGPWLDRVAAALGIDPS